MQQQAQMQQMPPMPLLQQGMQLAPQQAQQQCQPAPQQMLQEQTVSLSPAVLNSSAQQPFDASGMQQAHQYTFAMAPAPMESVEQATVSSLISLVTGNNGNLTSQEIEAQLRAAAPCQYDDY